MSAEPVTPAFAVIDRLRRMPRKMVLFVFALLVVGGAGAAWAATLAAAPSSQLTFTWSMPDRFGADADSDGLVDYPTTAAYLNPQSWRVDADACASKAVTDRGVKTGVTWTIVGGTPTQTSTIAGTCKQPLTVKKQGDYTVTAALTSDKSVKVSGSVTVKDTLIVSVGDSVASGEGNPDTVGPRQVGPFPFYKAKWEDQQCHRTALAGPAQAAVRLEKRDPHSSVTFLHLACSGAEIDTGLLQPYAGIEPKIDGKELPKKPAQLDDAVKLVDGRKIDTMLVSIGANNMGFGDIVKSCLALTDCNTTDQVPGGGDNAAKIYAKGVAKLPALYEQLDTKLDAMGKAGQLGKVVMTEYYDVSQFDDGATCTGQTPQERAGNVNPDNAAVDGFTKGEMAWTHDVVTPGINKAVADATVAANKNGGPAWSVVDTIDESFAKHGYCAKDRWIRQLFESLAYQHDQNGAFHPNTEGHLLGYGKEIEAKVASLDGIGGAPLPFTPDKRVKLSIDGVSNVLGALDNVDAFETVARSIPFGGRDVMQQGVQQLFAWMKEGQAKVKALSDKAGVSLTQLENQLDDIDGDGNPLSDVHIAALPALNGDLDVDISPKLLTSKYEVRIKLKLNLAKESDLAAVADGLKLNGQKLADDLGFTFDQTLTVDPLAVKPVTIPADGAQIARISLGMNGSYGLDAAKQNPLSIDLGLLQASAKGTVAADIGVGLKLVDPDGSGVIDATQLSKPGKLFDLRCVSKGAKIKLDVGGSFAGLGAKAGTITLDDTNLCDGISAPEVQLADLGQFRNLTLADLINGLAQVTRAIESAQAAGDLDLPFITEPLSAITSVNEKLVKFFVDNGFTDPANPMATITVDTDKAKITTLQALAPALEKALGLPAGALDMRFDDGRVFFTLAKSVDPAAKPNAGTLDFGDAMKNHGIAGLTGKAKASIDPAYELDLRFGFDLRPGLPLADRFFLANGKDGYAFALDADVKADVDVTGTVSVAALRLTDGDPNGAVTLLRRKVANKPMLTVAFNEPGVQDGRVTLAELATVNAAHPPVTAEVSAAVPSTTLQATADVLGQPVASGTVTLAWPSVSDARSLSVTADGKFTDFVLPFAFDTNNPKKLITDVLATTREAITRLRAAVASGASTSQTPLPLVGKSVADLDPVLAKVQTALDGLIATNEVTTLSTLRAKIDALLAKALGVDTTKSVPNLISLSYEAQTKDKPAALVVGLKLGACTDDRHPAGAEDGCTVTRAPSGAPFNLQLGPKSKVGGIAGIGAKGDLKISYDARARLTMGVTLPRVTANTDPFALPVVSGKPELFVQDDTGFTAGIGVKFSGSLHAGLGPIEVDLGNAGKPAVAQLATRFSMGAKTPSGVRMPVGSTALDTFLDGLVPASANGTGQTTVHETVSAYKATCPEAPTTPEKPDACAYLPVFSGDTELGSVTFNAMNLLDPSGWKWNSDSVEAALGNEAIQFQLIVNGVRTIAKQLEATLRSLPAGTRIPLLGTEVTSTADVVKTFDEKVMGKIDELSKALTKVATVGAAKDKTVELLNQIGIKRSSATVVAKCRLDAGGTDDCKGGEVISKLQSFEVALPMTLQTTRDLATFDIGFPGLRLKSDDKITGKAGLDLNLAFGIDRDLGFYVPTTSSEPELGLRVSGQLPKTMSGELAFLPITIADLTPDTDDVSVTAGVDLKTKRADGRLPLQDLASAEILPTLSAKAAVHLGVDTVRPEGALSALPTMHSDVLVDAGVGWGGTAGTKPVTNASVTFEKVSLDGGSLVTDFLKPAAREMRKITGPLEKPIDEIRKPIPGISDLATRIGKEPISWYKAFKSVDEILNPPGPNHTSGLQMIDRVIQFVDLVRAIDDDQSATGQIPLGSFSVDTLAAANPVAVSEAGKLVSGTSSLHGSVFDKLVLTDSAHHDDSSLLAAATDTGGLSFPAFEQPTLLFKMLLGQDVPLVYFDAGRLAIEKSFQLVYPVGPAQLYIGGMAGLSGHFAVGFDTFGIRKAFELLGDADSSNNGAWSIAKGVLQGLYVDDSDKDGNDVPEITLEAELTAGASIGVFGFKAGAEGGIHGQIDFDLHTEPGQNGKIRYTDIAKQFKVNPNPVCFFDASAQVDAFIRLYVETPLGRGEYPIASGTVWKQDDLLAFCRTQVDDEAGHLLADLGEDGTLTLKTGDDAQSIFLDRTDDNTVSVSANGIVESYGPVKKIFADLKAGDDELDVRQPEGMTSALPVTICGGAGNDRIGSEAGKATLVGDGGDGCPAVASAAAGNDTLTAGGSADLLSGGPGNDALDGGDGTDKLSGGDGNDVLRGGLGSDQLDGGANDDTTDYGDHVDAVSITLPGMSGTKSANEQDNAVNVEDIYGSGLNDTITVPATGSYRVDAGSGDDTVTTTGATSLIVGGDGDDKITTGGGGASVLGGAGNDTFRDGPGSQSYLGQDGRDTVDYQQATKRVIVTIDGQADDGPDSTLPDNVVDADVVLGTAFDDQLSGSGAGEELSGMAGSDRLDGGPGSDKLLGGDGDDSVDGGPDSDTMDGGKGNDILVGGTGADDFTGGPDFDTADYSNRTEGVTIYKDGVANDGSAVDSWHDNVNYSPTGDNEDIERMLLTSDRDTVVGDERSDVLIGNDGGDYLQGGLGSDTIDGGNGDDFMYDNTYNTRFDDKLSTAKDTFTGGPGDDDMYGNGGDNTYDGGDGKDHFDLGSGKDVVRGGDGNDSVYAGGGNDLVSGGAGDDNLSGEGEDDVLRQDTSDSVAGSVRGGIGNDTLYNGTDNGGSVYAGVDGSSSDPDDGPNTIYGYGGANNTYYGARGDDVMHLGDGEDTVYAGKGNDVVDAGDGRNLVYGDDGDDKLSVGGTTLNNVYAGKGNDTLVGGAAQDNLDGEDGDDTLSGGAGNDDLDGGTGDDTLTGGRNADHLEGDEGVDVVDYTERTAPVTVSETGNRDDGDPVFDLSNDPVYPGNLDYVDNTVEKLVGGSGDDTFTISSTYRKVPFTLDGGAGNDTLTNKLPLPATLVGGPGKDTLVGGSGPDVFVAGPKQDGADDMTGNDGIDAATYAARPAGSAVVSFDGAANDGTAGEHDNVRPDIESAPGAVLDGTAPRPTVSIAGTKVLEGKAGARTPAPVTVTLSSESGSDVTVPWSVASGTAVGGRDFVAASGTLTIPAGDTSAKLPVQVIGDALDEADESAIVRLGAATEATTKVGTATVTIADDDAAPALTITGASVAEGKAGKAAALTFTVRLSAASGRAVSVRVATGNGTARAGSDFVARTATLSFAPGQTVKTFVVTVRGDNVREANEVLYATLSKPVNASVRVAKAAGIIRNDDK